MPVSAQTTPDKRELTDLIANIGLLIEASHILGVEGRLRLKKQLDEQIRSLTLLLRPAEVEALHQLVAASRRLMRHSPASLPRIVRYVARELSMMDLSRQVSLLLALAEQLEARTRPSEAGTRCCA